MKQRWIFDLNKYLEDTDKDAKKWVLDQFPKKHYGEDILIYEAWSLRALLEQAYMAGKEYGRPQRTINGGEK